MSHDYGPTLPAPPCETHEGLHRTYQGQCYAFGSQVARPARFHRRPVVCDECGDELDVLKLTEGRVILLTAGTDRRHHHPPRPAPRVEIDEDGLAEAIVRASRATREERRSYRRPTVPSPPSSTSQEVPPSPHRVRLD